MRVRWNVGHAGYLLFPHERNQFDLYILCKAKAMALIRRWIYSSDFFLDRAKMLGNTVCMPFMNQQRTCESVAYLRNFHKCCCNWWQHFTRYYSNVIIRLIECRFFVFQIAICFQSSCVVRMNRFRSIEFSTKTERWFWFCWEKSNVNHSKLSFCSEIMVFAFVQSLV